VEHNLFGKMVSIFRDHALKATLRRARNELGR
jgi:hypothetical protein